MIQKNLIDYFNQGLCLGLDCAYCLDKTCVLSKIDYSNEKNEVKKNDKIKIFSKGKVEV